MWIKFGFTVLNNGASNKANRYLDKLLDMLQFLADHSELGNDRSEVKPGHRRYVVGPVSYFLR